MRKTRKLPFEVCEPRHMLAANLLISEILASNENGLRDSDNQLSDWIEIFNAGREVVDLGGWHLTDSGADLDRWEFSNVVLLPGERQLVFASGKDRRVAGGELHTNFSLGAGGEFLALVQPDGRTVAHFLGAPYPEQFPDISYGLPQSIATTTLIAPGANVAAYVPTNDSLGTDWTAINFTPNGWTNGKSGVGYDTAGNYTSLIGANLGGQMPGQNSSAYVRVPFSVTSPEQYQQLSLKMRYDDGFVAYLNGAEVARRNAPESLAWNSSALERRGGVLDARTFADFGDASGLSLMGNAVILGNRLRLTSPVANQRGAAWTQTPVSFDPGISFSTSFSFELSAPGGPTDGLDGPGGEGILFVLQSNGSSVLGQAGDSMGLVGAGGASQYFAVEFDTRPTGVWDSQRSTGNHISIVTSQNDLPVNGLQPTARFNDGGARYAWIDYDAASKQVKVFYSTTSDKPAAPTMSRTVDLATLFDGQHQLFAGFAGSTGSAYNAQEVLSWNIATGAAELGFTAEEINISAHLDLLRSGQNAFAIHALNVAADDADLLVAPELSASIVTTNPAGDKHFFRTPTPNKLNGSGILGFIDDVDFSHERGFYSDAFTLTLSSTTPDAEIRYTLDGTPPSESNGLVYLNPMEISATSTVRAAAVRPGYEPSLMTTHTYVCVEDVIRQTYQATLDAGFPTTWGGIAPDYGMDSDVIGQTGPDRFGGVYAAEIRDDMVAIPSMSIVMPTADLFGPNGIYTNSTGEGAAYERAASIELIDPTGAEEFQINGGLRIHGGAFRSHGLTKKHSFRVLFKRQYGEPNLDFPLFGDDAVDEFDTLVLRANANDGWQWDAAGGGAQYARDEFLRRAQLAMGQPSGHGRHVHLYLNGVYWGLYNLIERPDETFMERYLGGIRDEWDVINTGQPINGTLNAWNTLVEMTSQIPGVSETQRTEIYQRIQGKNPDGTRNSDYEVYLDVDNYIDYMIANLYGGNRDWPHNNYYMARRRGPESTGFKFFNWDAEWTMNMQSSLSENVVGVNTGVAAPYGFLRSSAEFRQRFADRLQIHFSPGGALYVNPASPAWNPAAPQNNVPAATYMSVIAEIEQAIVAESARWGDQHRSTPYTRNLEWRSELNYLLNTYLPQRSAIVLAQFRSAGLASTIPAPVFSPNGGVVPAGSKLGLNSPNPVYYTTDGSDPRFIGGGISPAAQLVTTGATQPITTVQSPIKFLVPTVNNGGAGLGASWRFFDFDDTSWTSAMAAIGYDRGTGYERYFQTDLETAMYNVNPSVYVRLEFNLEDVDAFDGLQLRMRYDDGFVAYLNGDLAAQRNAPNRLAYNSFATAERNDGQAISFENIDLGNVFQSLRPGRNVIAIQAMTTALGNDDFLASFELQGVTSSGGIEITENTRIRARALSNGNVWSPLVEATFLIDERPKLRVSELMYHPADPPPGSPYSDDDLEYVELVNAGSRDVVLSGIRYAAGIGFDFSNAAVDRLLPGQYGVLVRNREAFEAVYGAGALILGEFGGGLNNAGEHLILEDVLGDAILDFTYSDDWYPSTDGAGRSLVAIDLAADPAAWNEPTQWKASRDPGGTPGRAESIPGDTNGDGLVDIVDLNNVRNNFGGQGLGDTDGNGTVDIADLNAVRNNFGAGTAQAPLARPATFESARVQSPRSLSAIDAARRAAYSRLGEAVDRAIDLLAKIEEPPQRTDKRTRFRV